MDKVLVQEIYNRKFRLERLSTAKEFLNLLRLSNPVWRTQNRSGGDDNEWTRGWYFRGQADAKWDLVPSAWRKSINSPIECGKRSHLDAWVREAI
jgi:hypothetical protein